MQSSPTARSSTRSRPTSIPILKPQVLGIPYSCLDMNSVAPSCPTQCCSDSSQPQLKRSTTSTQSTPYPTYNSNDNSLSGHKNSDSKSSTFVHDVYDPYTKARIVPDSASGDPQHPNTLHREVEVDPTAIYNASHRTPDIIDTKKRVDETFAHKYGTVDLQSQNDYPKSEDHIREKRGTSEPNPKNAVNFLPQKDLAKSVDTIKLIELNATIGRQYCQTLQCIQQSGPKFNYLIPLSKYMELEYVTLQFRYSHDIPVVLTTDSPIPHSLSQHLKVDHCASRAQPTPCPSAAEGADNVPQSYHSPIEHILVPEMTPNWRIPIGLYLRSTFIFRVLSRDSVYDSVITCA